MITQYANKVQTTKCSIKLKRLKAKICISMPPVINRRKLYTVLSKTIKDLGDDLKQQGITQEIIGSKQTLINLIRTPWPISGWELSILFFQKQIKQKNSSIYQPKSHILITKLLTSSRLGIKMEQEYKLHEYYHYMGHHLPKEYDQLVMCLT